jgi:hypothetical protein
VEEATLKSKDIVQTYLMNEGSEIHEPFPPLISIRKKGTKSKKDQKKKKHRKEKGHRSDTSATSDSGVDVDREADSPVTFILKELRKVTPRGKSPRIFPSLQMYEDFHTWTAEEKKAYDKDAIAAVRLQDIEKLRAWKREGRILQAANAFGESLLHMACRRNFLDVVSFLVDEAGHSLWIRDDTGRTPLHDACWTTSPAPDLVTFIIDRSPDLLLVADKRGHIPMDYTRKEHWAFWIDFFARKDFAVLLPHHPCFYIVVSTPSFHSSGEGAIVDNLEEMFDQLHLPDEISSEEFQNSFRVDRAASDGDETKTFRRSSCP